MRTSYSLPALIFVLIMGLSSCATLTQSQIEAVNQYADVTTHYSAYPSTVLANFLTIRYANRLLITSQTSDRNNPLTYKDINQLYKQKKDENAAIQGLDIGIQTIDNYAVALKKLSSPDFAKNVGANAQTLGTSLDSLTNRYNSVVKPTIHVPFVGMIISSVLSEVGKRYVGYKQTAAIKKYVLAGDTLINVLTKSLEETMATHTATYILELEKDLGTFDNLLLKQLPDSAHYERYRFATETLHTIEKIDRLKEANRQSIRALQKLRSAHNELTAQLRQKQKITSAGKELFGLYQSVQDLQSMFQSISN